MSSQCGGNAGCSSTMLTTTITTTTTTATTTTTKKSHPNPTLIESLPAKYKSNIRETEHLGGNISN